LDTPSEWKDSYFKSIIIKCFKIFVNQITGLIDLPQLPSANPAYQLRKKKMKALPVIDNTFYRTGLNDSALIAIIGILIYK